MLRLRYAPLLAAALSSGCARDDAAYPSLAPRSIERLGFEEPERSEPRAAAPDPALDLEIAAATARLDKAQADFERAARPAETAAARARGAPAGGERWLAAQVALAELDGPRADTSEALTDLERLAVERATALAPAYPSLDGVLTRARDQLRRQDAVIARIGSSLAPA